MSYSGYRYMNVPGMRLPLVNQNTILSIQIPQFIDNACSKQPCEPSHIVDEDLTVPKYGPRIEAALRR
jgi:hypothetical protein